MVLDFYNKQETFTNLSSEATKKWLSDVKFSLFEIFASQILNFFSEVKELGQDFGADLRSVSYSKPSLTHTLVSQTQTAAFTLYFDLSALLLSKHCY